MATPTHETNRVLNLGERLRENPQTILLSIPVLLSAIPLFWLVNDPNSLAGAFGHLGLTFKLLYSHHWRNRQFLKIAYWLFSQACSRGNSDSRPTVLMKMGGISEELGNFDAAAKDYRKAVNLARQLRDLPQAAYAKSHLGRLYTKSGDLNLAKKYLDEAHELLLATIKRLNTPRMHIWLTGAELGKAEWYLALGDKRQAQLWAAKAAARAVKHDLKTRKLDATNLLKKISTA